MTNDHITFQLPVGYTDGAATPHRDGELCALTGKEEELLSQRYGKESSTSLVTTLLSRCVQQLGTLPAFSAKEAGQLPRVDRNYLLLLLWETTFGSRVRATVTCPGSGCGEKVDIDFSTTDIPVKEFDGLQFVLELEAHCHDCGQDFVIPYDFYRSFFARLRAGLDRLYREVHCLAYHYHWSEREIMEMPRNKRHRYLEILADEIERMNNAGESQYVIPYYSTMNQDRLFIEDSPGPGVKPSPGDHIIDPAAPLLTQPGSVDTAESCIGVPEEAAAIPTEPGPPHYEIADIPLPAGAEIGLPGPDAAQLKKSSIIEEKGTKSKEPEIVIPGISEIQLPGKTEVVLSQTRPVYKKIEQIAPGTETVAEIETTQVQNDSPNSKDDKVKNNPHSYFPHSTPDEGSPGAVVVEEKPPGGPPGIAKTVETRDKGEYKIPPYKGFPGGGRGEPCVHPAFSDRLPAKSFFHSSFTPHHSPSRPLAAEGSTEPEVVKPANNETHLPAKTKAGQWETPRAHRNAKERVKRKEAVMQEMRDDVDVDERIRRIRRETSSLKEPKSNPVTPASSQRETQEINFRPVISKPVQPVKGRDHGGGVPCAFWERNSLGRFHLNVLR